MPTIPLADLLEKLEALDQSSWNQPPGFSSQDHYRSLFRKAKEELQEQYQTPNHTSKS